ncbi:MAG: flagellar hook-length control protein FliK [Firmicutes bacterium]|nr:flagellar hook-length control protein FliK [Bacillota bacterium]
MKGIELLNLNIGIQQSNSSSEFKPVEEKNSFFEVLVAVQNNNRKDFKQQNANTEDVPVESDAITLLSLLCSLVAEDVGKIIYTDNKGGDTVLLEESNAQEDYIKDIETIDLSAIYPANSMGFTSTDYNSLKQIISEIEVSYRETGEIPISKIEELINQLSQKQYAVNIKPEDLKEEIKKIFEKDDINVSRIKEYYETINSIQNQRENTSQGENRNYENIKEFPNDLIKGLNMNKKPETYLENRDIFENLLIREKQDGEEIAAFDKTQHLIEQVGKSPKESINAEIDLSRIDRVKFIQEIANKISYSLRDNRSEIKLQLKPEILGKLTLEMVLEKGELIARFSVQNHQVKHLIEQNLPQLKQNLEQQGISVEGFNVFIGSETKQNLYHRSGGNKLNNDNNLALNEEDNQIITHNLREKIYRIYLGEETLINYIV